MVIATEYKYNKCILPIFATKLNTLEENTYAEMHLLPKGNRHSPSNIQFCGKDMIYQKRAGVKLAGNKGGKVCG